MSEQDNQQQLDQSALDALMDTPQTYDPEADNDVAPPPPRDDQVYNILVRLQERTDQDGGAKPAIYPKFETVRITDPDTGQPTTKLVFKHLVLALEASIDAPGERHDGFRISDWQTTHINDNGTSGAMNLVRIMGKPMPRGLAPNLQKDFFAGIFDAQTQMAGVPLAARIRWEATYKLDDGSYSKPFLKGMNRFPLKTYAKDVLDADGETILHSAGEFMTDEQGNHIHEHIVDNPSGGEPVVAQVRIARYLPRAEQAEAQGA